jgi:hypothetical protein
MNHNIKNKRTKKGMVVWLILFRLTLEMVFIVVEKESAAIYGYSLNIISYKYLLSWIICLPMFFLLKTTINPFNIKTSTIIINFLFIMSYIPIVSIYALIGLPEKFLFYVTIYWLIILFGEILFLRNISSIQIRPIDSNIAENLLKIIIFFALAYGLFFSYRFNGLRLNLNLEDIYKVRLDFRDVSIGTLNGYLIAWTRLVILPIGALLSFIKRKYKILLIICIVQLFLYSVDNLKTVFLIIPVGILGYLVYQDTKFIRFIKALVILNIIAVVEFLILKTNFISKYIVFRSFYTQATITVDYFDFFSKNTPDYLRQSIFRWFGAESEYSMPITQLISGTYHGTYHGNANTGMFADAYSNFGFLGVIIYPILFLMLLFLYNAVTRNIENRVLIVLLIMQAIAFTNVSFFNALLTQGVLASMIIYYLISCNKNIYSSKV